MKYIFFGFLFLFSFVCCSQQVLIDSFMKEKFFLTLSIKTSDNALVGVYYKGRKYLQLSDAKLGALFNIPDDKIPSHLCIIASPEIACRKKGDHVVGLYVPEGVTGKRYDLWYVVNDDAITYTWEIEESDCSDERIPEDAFIIVGDSQKINIEKIDSSTKTYCPQASSACGIVLLPRLVAESNAFVNSPLASLEIDRVHVVVKEIFVKQFSENLLASGRDLR